jgi:hypothetical protein
MFIPLFAVKSGKSTGTLKCIMAALLPEAFQFICSLSFDTPQPVLLKDSS